MDDVSTNSIPALPLIYEIIDDISSNYYPTGGESQEELVDKLSSIYWLSPPARRIMGWVHHNRVFLVATLSYELGIKPNTVYVILQKLSPWVLKTDRTIISPNPSTRGPHPRLWMIAWEVLLDRIEEARSSYYSTLNKIDPARELQKRERARREGLVLQVIERLGTPPDKLARVYEVIRELEIPEADQLHVKNGVLSWMHDYEEAT